MHRGICSFAVRIAVIALCRVSDANASDITFEKITRDISVEKEGTFTERNVMIAKLNTEAGQLCGKNCRL